MKTLKYSLLLNFLLCINVFSASFYLDFGDAEATIDVLYEGVTAIPGTWNSFVGNTQGLLDSNGIQTSVDVSISATSANGGSLTFGGNGIVGSLRNDNIFSNDGIGWSVTLSGLENGTYDVVYFDAAHPSVTTGEFEINGIEAQSLDSGHSSNLVYGANWSYVPAVSVTDGNLILHSTSFDGYRGISGMQVLDYSLEFDEFAPIPEPNSLVFLSFFVCLFVLRRKIWSRKS